MAGTTLEKEERSAFRSAVDTGLWDVWLASVLAMFAIAPLLSRALGDFWSVAVFLPVWAGLSLVLWWVHQSVIVPRVGLVRWSSPRKSRLRRFATAMLIVNVVALASGVVTAIVAPRGPREQWAVPIVFSLVALALFSGAAFALNLPRLFLYAVLIGAGPLLGEWLFRHGHASHHGFPVVFGALTLIVAAVGLVRLAIVVRRNRPIGDETSLGRNDA